MSSLLTVTLRFPFKTSVHWQHQTTELAYTHNIVKLSFWLCYILTPDLYIYICMYVKKAVIGKTDRAWLQSVIKKRHDWNWFHEQSIPHITFSTASINYTTLEYILYYWLTLSTNNRMLNIIIILFVFAFNVLWSTSSQNANDV